TSDKLAIDALTDMWQDWNDAGKAVVVIGEVPHFEELNALTCIESNRKDVADACSVPSDEVVGGRGTILTSAAESGPSSINFYDPVPGVCDDDHCYSMVGDLITRYDHHHLSADFARSYGSNFVDFMKEEAIVGS